MTALILDKKHRPSLVCGWLDAYHEDIVVVCDIKSYADETRERLSQRVRLVRIDNYSDNSWLIPICQKFDVDYIATTAESDILRAAYARELLGLEGQSVASALAYRDKYVMKSIARANGIRTPDMALVENLADVSEFARRVGFPVIVKPRDQGACQGVVIVQCEDDLRAMSSAGSTWPAGCLVEEHIASPLFHVDGLMHDGRVLHSWPSVYGDRDLATGPVPLPPTSGMLGLQDPRLATLQRVAAATIRALPATSTIMAFHTELFLKQGETEPVLCEIACRPGGAGVVEVYEHAFHRNLFQCTILGQIGAPLPEAGCAEPAGYFGWAWFFPKRGTLERLPAPEDLPGIVSCKLSGVIGKHYRDLSRPADQLAKVIMAVDPANLARDLRSVARWWSDGIVWAAGPETSSSSLQPAPWR